jgi:hypothetical protein
LAEGQERLSRIPRLQFLREGFQPGADLLRFAGADGSLLRELIDLDDAGGNLDGGVALLFRAAGDLCVHVRNRRHGPRDRRQRADIALDATDAVARLFLGVQDGDRRLLRAFLNLDDDPLDLERGRLGPLRQRPHLVGHDGETAALFAGPRRLDGGIERQQIGLVGNLADQADDAADVAACRDDRRAHRPIA